MLVLVLTIAGCGNKCTPVTEKTSPTPNAVQLTSGSHTFVEITAAASGPIGNGPCKDGMVLAASGNGTQQLLMGNVQAPWPASYDLAGWNGTTWEKRGTGPIQPPPTGSTESPVGSDNQTARLANGDLLLMWNSTTKSALSNGAELSWWNNWGPKPDEDPIKFPDYAKGVWPPVAPRAGYRGAQVIWRYSCTEGKWLTTRMLDGGLTAALDNKSPAVAQPGYCVQGPPWVRGFDRPELYVDPWGVDPSDPSKQRIFVSNRCSRWDDDSTQVFSSPDSGETWKPSGIRLAAATPVVMTSTKGRLFMFHSVGPTPALHWSDNNGESLATPPGGYDITYVAPNPQPGEQTSFPIGWLSTGWTKVHSWGTPTISLARAGPNAIIAVYPSVEIVKTGQGSGEFSRQVAAVVCVIPKGPGEAPIVIPIKIIRAEQGLGSVFMTAFIEDDRPDAEQQTSLLYWLETVSWPTNNDDPVQMQARYLVFNGIGSGKETRLSDEGGWKTKIVERYHVMGDYMKGSFYFHDGKLNFLAVWPQVPASVAAMDGNQAYMKIISLGPDEVPPAPAPAPPSLEAMPGARRAPRGRTTERHVGKP